MSGTGAHEKKKGADVSSWHRCLPYECLFSALDGNDELKKRIGGYVWVITEILFLALALLFHKGQGNSSISSCIKMGLTTFINLP